MKVRAIFFAYFRDLFGGRERDIDVSEGATVGEALAVLCDSPGRLVEIFVCGELKPHLVVMLNGVPIQSLKGLSTPLSPGDTLAIFPIMGGG